MISEATREKNRLRTKARADRLKEQGLCIRCGKKPAVEGRLQCEECAARALEYKRRDRENAKPRMARRYTLLKNRGMCVKCGQRPAIKGRVYCPQCTEQRRMYDAKRNLKRYYWSEELGEEYTPEEIADIVSGDNRMTSYKSAKYGVSYEQVLWMRREYRKGTDLTGIRKAHRQPRNPTGWEPLEDPEGDVNKLCGYCKRFIDYEFKPKLGIYGKCAADGKIRHRCDFCTAPEGEYASLGPNKCVRMDTVKHAGEKIGIWHGSTYAGWQEEGMSDGEGTVEG